MGRERVHFEFPLGCGLQAWPLGWLSIRWAVLGHGLVRAATMASCDPGYQDLLVFQGGGV